MQSGLSNESEKGYILKKHKTIIEQYDHIKLVEHLAYKMFDIVLENQEGHEHEYTETHPDYDYVLTEKGENVMAGFEEDVYNIINTVLNMEFDNKDREWRTKESFIESAPF